MRVGAHVSLYMTFYIQGLPEQEEERKKRGDLERRGWGLRGNAWKHFLMGFPFAVKQAVFFLFSKMEGLSAIEQEKIF